MKRAVEARSLWLESLTTAEIWKVEDEQQELSARITRGGASFPLPALGYEVSDLGRVRNAKSVRILRLADGNFGYLFEHLMQNKNK
ncbi:hypothetical protein PS15p_205808 [Mucor circinelloides]